jgi:hypothetical protein
MSEEFNWFGEYYSIVAKDIASDLLELLTQFVPGNVRRTVLLCARDYGYVIQLILPDNIRKAISWGEYSFSELLENISTSASLFWIEFYHGLDHKSLNIELASKIRAAFLEVIISRLAKIDREQIEHFFSLCIANNFHDLEKLFQKHYFLNEIVDYCLLGNCSFKQLATFLCLPSSIEMLHKKLMDNKVALEHRQHNDDTESLSEPHLDKATENDL